MPFAVALFFDSDFDRNVRRVWAGVSAQAGVEDWMAKKGSRPHLALAVFEDGEMGAILKAVGALAEAWQPFEIRLESFGSFAGQEGVLFLAPTPTHELLKIHKDCQDRLLGLVREMWSYYHVDKLVFHCTANIGLSPEELMRAMAAARTASLPIIGTVASIGLVKFPDVEFLGDFNLGQKL